MSRPCRPALLPLLLILGPGCAQSLDYVAVVPEGVTAASGSSGSTISYVATQKREKWTAPFVGNREVHREVRKLPRRIFEKARGGTLDATSCWRFTTADAAAWSAERWTLEAVLADHLVLLERGKPASHVVDAEDLRWIESPASFPVELRGRMLRARRVGIEAGARIILDDQGKTHRAVAGEVRYAPPRDAPPDVVFGFDREGTGWPLDLMVIRGFIEGADTSTIVLGGYRTVPLGQIRRWEFDREWGPWSIMLAPYLAARWTFTNKDYIARCERFP